MTFLKKILLVDYQPCVATVVRKTLENTGKYLIKEEHDCRHAPSAARWFQPDVILFDGVLNRTEPLVVAQQMKADPSFAETPIVFLAINTSAPVAVAPGAAVSGYSFTAAAVSIGELVRYVAQLVDLPARLGKTRQQVAKQS